MQVIIKHYNHQIDRNITHNAIMSQVIFVKTEPPNLKLREYKEKRQHKISTTMI